jgi:hypothetical protein
MIEKMSLPPGSLPDFHVSHRVTRLSRGQDGSTTILCSHDLDDSINVWLNTTSLASPDEMPHFTLAQEDAIAKDIARSAVLSQSQKDDMVKDIKDWPRA